MEIHKPNIIQVLEHAQLAHRVGDFAHALKFYVYFFDHALDDDPFALYGVRLSHCLEGWSKLAQEFVAAQQQLEEKQTSLLQSYQTNKQPEKFHDYYCISDVLGKRQEAIDTFLLINQSNHLQAKKLIKFVWKDLINIEQWEVCNEFLEDPLLKLDESFAIFDQANTLKNLDPSFATEAFEKHIQNELIESVKQLLLILRHNDRTDEIDLIQRKFYEIAHSKSNANLDALLHTKGTFLFSGH